MARLPDFSDPIDYLVNQKFPPLVLAYLPPSLSAPHAPRVTPADREARRQKAGQYREELQALSSEQLETLMEAEKAKEMTALLARAAKEEAERYFNQPYASGDFDHWSKAQFWTIDEAVALSLGKAPEVVKWADVSPLIKVSKFVIQYSRIRDLALRAVLWKTLNDPVHPPLFVAWAQKNDIAFPTQLAQAVLARQGDVIDWRARYERLKADTDQFVQEGQAGIATMKRLLSQQQSEAAIAATKTGPTVERDSMLKLIVTMAIKKYRYDPSALRNESVSRIKTDLESCGLSLDDATILKYLRHGAELLPAAENKDR